VKVQDFSSPAYRSSRVAVVVAGIATAALLLAPPRTTLAQQSRPALPPVGGSNLAGAAALAGRTVEDVRILGNSQVSTAVILNLVRTHPGDKFDPQTVQEDYQRIYGMRKFSNVEAKVEPTATGGVVVVFVVTEQKQVNNIRIRGNFHIDETAIRSAIEIKPGEAIDRFRIALARQAIERLYKDKNFPFAHVTVDADVLARTGDLAFNIVEGPNVRVRKVHFIGNHSFSEDKLKDQVQTKSWIWIFRSGTYDPNLLEDDIGALRRYYQQHGFFDVRVGRKVVVSPDMSEIQVDFVIEEGPRYVVDKITFKGNATVSEAELRRNLKLVEGQYFDWDVLQRDIRSVVRAYSPYGFIYQPGSTDPDYLRIGAPLNPFQIETVFRREAGRVELIYPISEGKAFHTGRIIVKGNAKTQDKVLLREMRVQPGQLYNSGEIQDASDRLRGLPGLFTGVNISPTGDEPDTRDVLVEVQEGRTASFNIGAGINSNGGVGGNITYEQRNFDIMNVPGNFRDLFTDRAFTGAGQSFRASFEPGTVQSNASLRFYEPWVFDQPYGFGAEAYLRNRIREDYTDSRIGGRVWLDHRFDNTWSARLTLRGEDVDIHSIDDKEVRSFQILDAQGHSTLTSVGLQVRRDTTNRGILPSKGTTTTLGWESFGALGGNFTFQKFTLGYDFYQTLAEDLLDRKTILALHADVGYIIGNDPFFERFYGGGIGSIRGFAYRGVSPRDGPEDDRIGGDFSVTGTAEVSFPLYAESLRGVVFTDVGMVEEDVRIGTIRSSVGAGIRLTLPILGQVPIAIDVAIPLSKNSQDDTQIISFSLGFER
jgi:outer membrane protein insertion porin family